MLKLKRLSVKKHPMLDGPVDLHFSDGENILVGINGSGKTTLLELIKCCLRGDFSQFKDSRSEIELAYQITDCNNNIIFDVDFKLERKARTDLNLVNSQIKTLFTTSLENVHMEEHVKIDVVSDRKSQSLLLKNGNIKLQNEKTSQTYSIDENYSILYTNIIFTISNKFPNFILENDGNINSLGNFFFEITEEALKKERFSEGLEYFSLLTESSEITIPQNNTDSDKSPIILPYFLEKHKLPDDIINIKEATSLIVTSQVFPLLEVIKREFDFKSINLSFNYKGKERDGNGENLNKIWEGFKLIIDIDEDTTITDDKLSYGEKRFISLMLYLEGCGDVIILDEPINGLHHNLIDTVVDEIYSSERQCFIANQNSTLFDYIDFNSADEVKNKIIFCTKKEKKMSWRNPTDDEAKELFTEVEKDFMYLGEILRMKNLW